MGAVAGGIVGTSLRAATAELIGHQPGTLPTATLAVNLAGALLLGLVVGRRRPRPGPWGAFVATGLLGSLTTFSTFCVEVAALAGDDQAGLALLYAVGSVAAGLAMALAGLRLGRRLRLGVAA